MSVVNRMLQDIDRRGTPSPAEGPFSGVRSVPEDSSDATRGGARIRLVWVGVLLAVAAAMLSWMAMKRPEVSAASAPRPAAAASQVSRAPPQPPATGTPGPVVPPEVTAAPVAPAAAPVAPAIALVASAASSEPAASREKVSKPAQETAPNEQQTRARPLVVEPFRLSLKLSDPTDAPATRTARAKAKAPPPAALASSAPAPEAATSTPASRRTEAPLRQVAAEETVVTARALWSRGAHADSMATLRQGLATAEATRDAHGVRTLARELARLEVAANRPRDAVDLLKRLEALLADDAESWALRGNAEQRLGLHAEAAQSYLVAQRLAPTEGKWMLGAAISLAAQGRSDEAQGWVDRARERGAITPTIAAYLQELGIAARR